MSRRERLARIASKMKHPSMNVDHQFYLITDKAPDLDKKDEALLPLFPAVSISPDNSEENPGWLARIKSDYACGLLH